MTTNAALIEALVKLTDEFSQLHGVHGPTAYMVVEDVMFSQDLQGHPHLPLQGRYKTLVEQAEAMILRYYGASVLDYELLEDLLDEMDSLEENAND